MKHALLFVSLSFSLLVIACERYETPLDKDDSFLEDFRFMQQDNPLLLHTATAVLIEQRNLRIIVGPMKLPLDALIARFDTELPVYVNGIRQISGASTNDFRSPVVYQIDAGPKGTLTYTITVENHATNLPILYLNTQNAETVYSRDEWISGDISVQDATNTENNFEQTLEIKCRGTNSWHFDKKAYTIKLGEKESFFGLPKHKRWVLIPNFCDKTLLRNRIGLEISNRTSLAWTPRSHYVELVLNGEYRGNYLLCEQIRVDKNRVNVGDDGFILEMDTNYDEVNRFRSRNIFLPVMIKEPDEDAITTQQIDYIKEYFNHVEDLLYTSDTLEYRNLIDVDSFVDFWIVNELASNLDCATPRSFYMHKTADGLLTAGPVWDFDLGSFLPSLIFVNKYTTWFQYLFKDPGFCKRVKERWNDVYPRLAEIPAFIKEQESLIGESAICNFAIWPMPLKEIRNMDNWLSHPEAVQNLIANYTARLMWMNSKIQTLDGVN